MDDPHKLLKLLAESEKQKRLAQEKEQIIDVVTKIMAAMFDKAATYTNLIIVAGYAAFFTIWSHTKAFMTRKEMISAALCISISCLLFIIWEITKMILFAKSTRKLNLIGGIPADKIKDELDSIIKSEGKLQIKIYKAWVIILAVTVAFGLGGTGILVYSFIRQLIAV